MSEALLDEALVGKGVEVIICGYPRTILLAKYPLGLRY